jgi:hypothetical protein
MMGSLHSLEIISTLFGQTLNLFDQMANRDDLVPDYEYEIEDNNEEEKNAGQAKYEHLMA